MQPEEVGWVTHDRAEEMDHGVLGTALAGRSRRGFLSPGGEGASERPLAGEETHRQTGGTLRHHREDK